MPQRSFSRDQPRLLPPSFAELVPLDHSLRFVAAFVEALPEECWQELGIEREPAQRGAPRYAPTMLLLVWLAGFMQGTRTTRKLEYACRYDLVFRWLTGDQQPDHNTLWRFYAAHRQTMRALLRQSVLTAVNAHLADLAEQAVDGAKVLANAARARSLTREEMERLESRIAAVIADLESQQHGDEEPPPPSLPAELATQQALRERVAEALAQVDADDQKTRINQTDIEARMMKTRQGVRPGYNAQAVVVALDAEQAGTSGRLIVQTSVRTAADDHAHLVEMIAAAQVPGQPVPQTLADGGYHSGAMLEACAGAGYRVVMPETQTPAQRRNPYHKDHFIYDAEADSYTCPRGRELTFRQVQHRKDDGRTLMIYRGDPSHCRSCPAGDACTTSKRWGRTLQVGCYDDHLQAHRRWMTTDAAQQAAKRRGPLIEPVFGTIKEQLRAHRFLLRGREQVDAEWALLATAYNLRTLARIWATNATFRAALGAAPASHIAAAA